MIMATTVKLKRSNRRVKAPIADETLGRKHTKHNETFEVWKALVAALRKLGPLRIVKGMRRSMTQGRRRDQSL